MTPLLRLRVHVPMAHVRAMRASDRERGQKLLLRDVQTRIARMGYSPAYAALQDPTREEWFTVLAGPPSGAPRPDPLARVLKSERVASPDAFPSAPRYDSALTADENAAVDDALRHSTDPRHLGPGGFVDVLAPVAPSSVSLLRLKTMLLALEKQSVSTSRMDALLARVRTDKGDARVDAARDAFERWLTATNTPVIVARDDVRAAALRLLARPADALSDLPRPVADLAKSMIAMVIAPPHTTPFPVIPPDRAARALPPRSDDGFVSPSALQLALSQQKPRWSRVGEPAIIGQVFAPTQSGARDPRTRKAAQQMARAPKALDRRRWVEWYRHHRGIQVSHL